MRNPLAGKEIQRRRTRPTRLSMELNSTNISLKPLPQFPSSSSSSSSSSSQHQLRRSLLLKPLKPSVFSSPSILRSRPIPLSPKLSLSASSAEPVLSQKDSPPLKEKLRVVVKPMEKPRIVLQFLWMEDTIGVALNQVIPRHGTIPLTPYHFWPHQDALEELKKFLESKPWISNKQMTILLFQLSDFISKGKEVTNRNS